MSSMKLSNTIILACILIASLWHLTNAVGGGQYNFLDGPLGPQHWGDLKEEWKACSTGTEQSPIEISTWAVEERPYEPLDINYKASEATLINRGSDITVEWVHGGDLVIDGTSYILKQMHWHHPSEHFVDGTRFPLEAHMVHISEDNKIAVIACLFAFGPSEAFLSKVTPQFGLVGNIENATIGIGMIHPQDTKFKIYDGYYRYTGSLTTPPCTGDVTWTVLTQPRTATWSQIEKMRAAILPVDVNNARPIQPLNSRVVKLYKPY